MLRDIALLLAFGVASIYCHQAQQLPGMPQQAHPHPPQQQQHHQQQQQHHQQQQLHQQQLHQQQQQHHQQQQQQPPQQPPHISSQVAQPGASQRMPNPNAQHGHGVNPHPQQRFRDGAKDRQHIMEHLDGMVDTGRDREQMGEDEVQFHYFKLHDYDNNNRLDGIELISALTHYHKDEDPNNVKPLTDADLERLVDTILQEDDRNQDGYIDYPEFSMSQRT